jgi:hypothetical protein
MQQQEKELFQDYEIKNWNYSPRLYKILGAAAVFNLLAIFVVGQGNLLTRKGCDSPMVSRVCQVLDTVYIGGILLGTERNEVDIDYVKTELEDADITYIDVSGAAPPLKYPEGYFALANPESQFMAMNNPTDPLTNPSGIPGIPGFQSNPTITNGTDLLNTPQVTPPPNKDAIQGNIPTSPFETGENPVPPPTTTRTKPPRISPRQSKIKDKSPTKLPNIGDTTAENNPTLDKQPNNNQEEPKSDPVAGVEINKKPIKDLGVFVNELVNNENIKLNLETPFVAKAKGKLTKEGRLDPKSFKIEANSPDKNMIEVVQESIEAINDAGYLQYLKVLSGKDLNLILSQDNESITAVVQSELESDTRANSIKSGFNLMISGAKLTKTEPGDKDDLDLLNSATVESKGKNIIIKFAIPKALAQEMIKRKLLEQATKPQTNGTPQGENTNQRAEK